jgi:hypothetical protein
MGYVDRSFALWYLARFPRVQDKLRVELLECPQLALDALPDECTYAILSGLPYLDLVTNEMFAFWAPAAPLAELTLRQVEAAAGRDVWPSAGRARGRRRPARNACAVGERRDRFAAPDPQGRDRHDDLRMSNALSRSHCQAGASADASCAAEYGPVGVGRRRARLPPRALA